MPIFKLQIVEMEAGLGVVLPPEISERLNLQPADTLAATLTDDGVLLTPSTASFEEQMRVGREIMKERWQVLRDLAK